MQPKTRHELQKWAWDWSHGMMIQMKMLLMMKISPRALSVLCRVMMSVSVGSPVKADHPLSKQDTTSLPFATIPSKQTHEHTQKETHTQMYANSHTQTKDYRKNVSHHKDAHAYTNTCTQLGYTWESKLQCGGTATMLNPLHKHTLTPISDDGDADNHAFVEKSFCCSFLATQVLLLLLVLLLI